VINFYQRFKSFLGPKRSLFWVFMNKYRQGKEPLTQNEEWLEFEGFKTRYYRDKRREERPRPSKRVGRPTEVSFGEFGFEGCTDDLAVSVICKMVKEEMDKGLDLYPAACRAVHARLVAGDRPTWLDAKDWGHKGQIISAPMIRDMYNMNLIMKNLPHNKKQ